MLPLDVIARGGSALETHSMDVTHAVSGTWTHTDLSSLDGKYRYALEFSNKNENRGAGTAYFMQLFPKPMPVLGRSEQLSATVKKFCINNNIGTCRLVSLYSLVCDSQDTLAKEGYPAGPFSSHMLDAIMFDATMYSSAIVACWGSSANISDEHCPRWVWASHRLMMKAGFAVFCLGTSLDGMPVALNGAPVMVNKELVPWSIPVDLIDPEAYAALL